MRKFLVILLSVLLLYLCASCKATKESLCDNSISSEITTSYEETTVDPGPPRIVPPDEIEVMPLDQDPFPVPYERQYRLVYHGIRGPYMYLVPDDDDYNDFQKNFEDANPNGIEISEMYLVTFIKRFDISREKFDKALAKDWQKRVELEWDTSLEEFELPNPDIIYTFDNEIINAYYRRDNPVAPDWLGTERAKDFTYESYSAYLEANPE